MNHAELGGLFDRAASAWLVSSVLLALMAAVSRRASRDAAVRHADLLTKRPADAQASDLQALKDAGFTPAGILSLSQVIAFTNYQLRLIAGLRAFGENA